MDLNTWNIQNSKTFSILDTVTPLSFDIGIGYIDTTTALLTWNYDNDLTSTIMTQIKNFNPSINKYYTVIHNYDTYYETHLLASGFTFVEDSTIGPDNVDCKVYEYV